MDYDLTQLSDLVVHAAEAEVVTWQGRRALKLVNGLALIRDHSVTDARIEVTLGTDGAAYAGIAFRALDRANYELGYVQPHTSGQWDAIQYDPVFHLSNTWQVVHGPAYQQTAAIPTGAWLTLRADVKGDRVAFSVDDQPPLIVPRLLHSRRAGHLGLWTYLPAYFRDLRVTDRPALPDGTPAQPQPLSGAVDEWYLEGFGRVECESNGILMLNRYLPTSVGEVVLTRQLAASARETIMLAFGFSDELALLLDDQPLFQGTHTFSGMASYASRGYVDPEQHTLFQAVEPGVHTLTARLKVTEGFGWGLGVAIQGQTVTLLPVL